MFRRAIVIAASLLAFTVAGSPAIAQAAPAKSPTNVNIWMLNGSQAAGADCITTGCTMKSKSHPGRTIVADTSAHTLRWTNGGHIGMDPTCSFVVTNPSGDFGTYWTLQVATGNGLYYANRACGGFLGAPNNSLNTRWSTCDLVNGADCSGWYLRLNIVGA